MPQVINTNKASNEQLQAKLNNAAQKDANVALELCLQVFESTVLRTTRQVLSISSRLTTQISGMNQAIRNANDGVSLVQTAEGALNETTNMLQRLRELASSGCKRYKHCRRPYCRSKLAQLKNEINRIASNQLRLTAEAA